MPATRFLRHIGVESFSSLREDLRYSYSKLSDIDRELAFLVPRGLPRNLWGMPSQITPVCRVKSSQVKLSLFTIKKWKKKTGKKVQSAP